MLIAIASLIAAPASAKDQADHRFGPPPTWQQFRATAEAGLRDRLVDPDSAKITWTDGYYKGEYKPFLQARVAGYIACGELNARNQMGGYVGARSFVVVVDYDRVLFADVAKRPTDIVAEQCSKMRQEGGFPPLQAMPGYGAGAPGSEAVTSAAGLDLRAMPEGAYVTAVSPASQGAIAGIRPGMVISDVNGIPLAGMGDAMIRVVGAAGSGAKLTIIGGSTFTLGAGEQ